MTFINKIKSCNESSKNKYSELPWQILLTVFMCAIAYLSTAQLVVPGSYPSDLSLYMDFITAGEKGYSLYSLIMRAIYALNITSWLVYFADMMLIVISNLASIIIIRKYLKERFFDSNVNQYTMDFLSIALFLVSMIVIIFPTNVSWYLGVGSGNPWHSPTYYLARPFSILMFIYMIKAYQKPAKKELTLLALFSVLSCWSKPSFAFVFIPGCFIVFAADVIKHKFSNFKNALFTALAFLPSVSVMLLQNSVLFGGEQGDNVITFGLSPSWVQHAPFGSIPLAILLASAFPLYMTVVSIKKLDLPYKLSIATFVIGILENAFIYETGSRMFDGNFGWGYQFSMFFMFLVSSMKLFGNPPKNKILRTVGYILFGVHLLCGCMYLLRIILFGSYP